MRTHRLAAIVLAAILLLPAVAACSDTIGVVRTLSGSAVVLRAGAEIPLAVGSRLCEGDRLTTKERSTLGALMRDNAGLSMGPSSTVSLDRFRFAPATREYSFLARIARGTVAYVSGLIGKSSPGSVRMETPVASLAVRGTRFAVRVDD